MSAQLKLPCLGRPFKLGMLYNSHTDNLIPGKTLWDSKILNSALQASAQTSSIFEVIAEDTIHKKCLSLAIEPDLRLSFLSGMVEVGGAAKFLKDRKSSERQSRVTLKYSCTTRFEQLTMEQLGTIQYPEVLDDQHATHVVTGVLYGADAFFVFDRKVGSSENLKDIHAKMEAQIKFIPISVQHPSPDIVTDNINCNFYGDIILPSNPSTFDEAVQVYRELPRHLKLNCDAGDLSIPKAVYLSPLSELDGKPEQIGCSISSDLISQVENILESFHRVEVVCNDHRKDDICPKFPDIESQISTFLMLVDCFKMNFVKKLSVVVPMIRSSKADEKELAELISSVYNSPFNFKEMDKFLKGKGREIKQLTQHLKNAMKDPIQFIFPSTNCDLDTLMTDDEIEHVICFAFNVTSDTSSYINCLESFLEPGKSKSDSKEWFEKPDVSKDLKLKLKSFKDFVEENSGSKTSAFVVTDRNDDTDASGPAIILYDSGVPTVFELPGKPGVPKATHISHDSVKLVWSKPNSGSGAVTSYILHGSSSPHQTADAEPSIHISGLSAHADYHFQVQAVSGPGVSIRSDTCTVKTKRCIRAADAIKKESKLVAKGNPDIYKLPKVLVHSNQADGLFKYRIGSSKPGASLGKPEKVLLLVGATGSGKSTLINGMVNYLLGVEWRDDFRFKLIVDEGKSQALSQTKDISAYTFDLKHIPYSITIIDTPGFGDTGGIDRDRRIARQIKQFFSTHKGGIELLHGIGFVTQASFSRLTPTQKYIFDATLSIFGKDIVENIFLMATFADAYIPTVLEATRVADIPYKESFKFNNSALFASNDSSDSQFNSMFWDMGYVSFGSFFDHFSRAEPRSLDLTREVLKEREQLETLLPGLQEQVRVGLSHMDAIQQEERVLKQHEADITANKEFTYEVDEVRFEKIALPDTVTTTCLTCSFTCHKSCAYRNDSEKRNCSAMDRNGYCEVCPANCIWNLHANLPYHIEYYTECVTRTSQDLKSRYDTAKAGKQNVESMIAETEEVLEQLQIHVFSLVDNARRSIERLNEIALKPNPLTELEYLDLLIESETVEARPGWQSRVSQYMKMRKNAEILKKVPQVSRNNARKNKSWWQKLW